MLLTDAQARALERLRDLASNHALLTFRPSPVFAELPEVDAAQVLIRAANRVGKTRHVAWYIAKRMVDEAGIRCRVIGPTVDHVHNVLGQYLAEFVGPHLAQGSYYVNGKGWNGGRARVIILENGSTCELRSLQDEPAAHSGKSLHVVAFDEPPTLAHYVENAARLVDTAPDSVMIIAATMVNSPIEWLRRMVQGEEPDPGPGRHEHPSGWTQIVATFSQQNCPWYSAEQVKQWLSIMRSSPWAWGQRIEAAWDGVTPDRLFVGVSEETFKIEAPSGQVRIGLGIDHGLAVGGQAAILIAYRGTRCWVLDEYQNTTTATPEDDAAGILAMLARQRIRPTDVDLCVGDIGSVRGYIGWRINEALEGEFRKQTDGKRAPFRIEAPDKTPGSVEWGIRCVNYGALRGDITIHPGCTGLMHSLRHWKGGKKGHDGGLSHLPDAFRYILTAAIGTHASYARLRFD